MKCHGLHPVGEEEPRVAHSYFREITLVTAQTQEWVKAKQEWRDGKGGQGTVGKAKEGLRRRNSQDTQVVRTRWPSRARQSHLHTVQHLIANTVTS